MDERFWSRCWETQEIGFHLPEVNPALHAFWNQLSLDSSAKVLLPLCGKSLDLKWLAQQGCHVVGVELSQLAVDAFFSEQSIQPDRQANDKFQLYTSNQLEIWCGDIFDFPDSQLEMIQAVYDRAALVALPSDMRKAYIQKLLEGLPNKTRWLLVTLEYDENLMHGPPFSVSQNEVQEYFEGYDIRLVNKKEMIEVMPKAQSLGLKSIQQCVYVITP